MTFNKLVFYRLILLIAFCFGFSFPAPKSILHLYGFGEPWGLGHAGTESAVKKMLENFRTKYGVNVTSLNKQDAVNELAAYNVVIVNNVGRNAFTTADTKLKFKTWLENGGKLIGYHSSDDHSEYWDWWSLIHAGTNFTGHDQNVTYKLNSDPEMNTNAAYKRMWTELKLEEKAAITAPTEMYIFKKVNGYSGDPRGQPGVTMLQVAAPGSFKLGSQDGLTYRPMTWEKKIGKGKYIYTAIGHGTADFEGGYLEAATWGWAKYLVGDYDSIPTGVQGQRNSKANGLTLVGKKLEVNYGNAYKLKITDVVGKEALAVSGQGLHNYSLNTLKPGIYFAKVSGKFGSHKLRILIN
jgi:type 1 glutamine amidotransferase